MNAKVRKLYTILMLLGPAFEYLAYCDVPMTTYFNPNLSVYINHPIVMLFGLLNYLIIYLIFGCFMLRISNPKRMALVFLLIQPIKLINDLMITLISKFIRFLRFPAMTMTVTFVMALVINTYLDDKKRFRQNMSESKGMIVKAVVFGLVGDIVFMLICLLNTVIFGGILNKNYTAPIVLVFSLIPVAALTALLAVVAWYLNQKAYKSSACAAISEHARGTKVQEYIVFALPVVLSVIAGVYYLPSLVNVVKFLFA